MRVKWLMARAAAARRPHQGHRPRLLDPDVLEHYRLWGHRRLWSRRLVAVGHAGGQRARRGSRAELGLGQQHGRGMEHWAQADDAADHRCAPGGPPPLSITLLAVSAHCGYRCSHASLHYRPSLALIHALIGTRASPPARVPGRPAAREGLLRGRRLRQRRALRALPSSQRHDHHAAEPDRHVQGARKAAAVRVPRQREHQRGRGVSVRGSESNAPPALCRNSEALNPETALQGPYHYYGMGGWSSEGGHWMVRSKNLGAAPASWQVPAR